MTTRRLATFRVDASARIGFGHLSRCLALANYLAEGGWNCIFVVKLKSAEAFPQLRHSVHRIVFVKDEWDANSVGIAVGGHSNLTVIDHYELGESFEASCRNWSDKILVIDDLANRQHDCDFLLDQSLGRKPSDYIPLTPRNCHLLLGPKYALLRPEFGRLHQQALERRRDSVNRLLIAIGGSDPYDITSMALQAVHDSGLHLKVDVVLGSISPNCKKVSNRIAEAGSRWRLHLDTPRVAELMAEADLAIGACGIGSWERCVLGLPAITVVIAENQRMIAHELERRQAIIYAGDWLQISAPILESHLREIAVNSYKLTLTAASAATICDGLGLERVKKILSG